MWEVWKGDVIELIRDPLLRGDLALFFGDLDRIEGLNRELIRVSTGSGAALMGAGLTRAAILGLLSSNAAQAAHFGHEVAQRLKGSGPEDPA